MWLSNHAKRRMVERGISENQVLSVLRGSAAVTPSKTPGASLVKGEVDGCNLTVVIGTGTENVITAYWTKTNRRPK
ncbi:MAG: DUF4258 domain-containing protein [Candidatus Fibromonas sp.]|nr:DUF4258 domain-containing protein [Candidatus Fibromonas sp.]